MVRRLRAIAILVILASGLALWPSPAPAAIQELKLDLWPTTWTATATNGTGSHSAAFIGLDYRYTGAANWGLHLKGDIASESGWSGALFAGATSGTDSLWSADAFYAWQLSAATIRGFVGYGGIQFSTTFGGLTQTLTSNGFRVGGDAAIPIPATPVSVNVSVAWYPSDTSTFNNNGVFTSASGSATDSSLTIQYNWGTGWLAEGGYRWVNRSWGSLAANCPCSDQWSGPIFTVGKRW
ncbi:MAG TPA: hypothetical protein VKW09_07195 [bacterium]|nr:hypothetical protein [bacterium]